MEHLARATQTSESKLKQRKLKDIEKETGFPTFVCPPFGHPKDSQDRLPLLLVDSSMTEQKRPLLFDCGTVGLSVMPNDFILATQAACIEGLAKDPPAEAVSAENGCKAVTPAVPEAVMQAPTPGKVEMQLSLTSASPDMPGKLCLQTSASQSGLQQAEVQQPAESIVSSGDVTMES